ncbi:hypothetical protein [Piscinibacter gummiphilus]|uniref:Uncharacterized protein n=1 Tax=Piscinibacter gummiphilus TaxID=946333 RepID=A0ABZ0CVI2_9BURK|nr:hypothetical protein [Piscinibacter gummiphilus]WOB06524.1 hypothetical protein RXV79_16500 [Piscinibacter gummiphilus]
MTTAADRPGARERLVGAFQSSDLSIDERTRGDADYLIALGLAGQSNPRVSGSLLRITIDGRQADYKAARKGTVELTKRLNAERNWRLSGPSCQAVGELALAHHIFPVCPACDGRKFQLVPGTPHLSATPCQPCGGTGERRIQRKHHNHIRDVIEMLSQIDGSTVGTVKRLANGASIGAIKGKRK